MKKQKRQDDSKVGMRRIPMAWFKLAQDKEISFWLRVHEHTKRRGVAKHDYAGVQKIVKEISNDKCIEKD